ncbi:MAG: endonuclease MutS2 [candidate division Zixibacteria bacterium]|nr:endonuclease MutS2 [candidate division Zixibacteria bacterium]
MDSLHLTHSLGVLEFDAVRRLLAERTVSIMGRELAVGLTPLSDMNVVRERLDNVSEMRSLLDVGQTVPLAGVRDIRAALERARIADALLDPETLLDTAATLQASRVLKGFSSRLPARLAVPRVTRLLEGLGSFQEIEEAILRAIDTDGSIKDQASPELRRIRRDQHHVREKTREHLNRFVQSDAGRHVLQESVVTLREGRYVVPVRADHRGQVPGVVHDQSASGATVFVEPLAVVEINNRLRELISEERREIERILRELTTGIRRRLEDISVSVDLLGLVDYFHAAAVLSVDLRAAAPRINREGRIVLRNARHPLLAISTIGSETSVVPLTLAIGEKATTLLITGPNMGGKTLALKTVGLLTLMALAGLHVPADDDSELSVFTQIFADIGDEQSIQANLSTFSAHLRHITAILQQTGDGCLVLLDELGSGTDPSAGAALGMAILETLTARRVITLATTHFGVLKDFAARTPGVENGSMEFDVETLSPAYRFRQGIPGGSYAIEIGRRLGLPAPVLERTAQFIGKKERRLEELIMQLDRERRTVETEKRETERLRKEAEGLITEYEEKIATARRTEREMREKIRAEAERTLRQASETVERAVAEIRAERASDESVKHTRKTLEDQRTVLQRLIDAGPPLAPEPLLSIPPEKTIHPGDRVRVERLRTSGVVLKDLGDRVRIRAGAVELTVAREDVRLEETPDAPKTTERATPSVRVAAATQAPPELDVRGHTADEAIDAVDKYLDQASVDGRMQARILHGKGTGVLSREIRAFLKHHPVVKTARFAEPREGGTGVTVVELDA